MLRKMSEVIPVEFTETAKFVDWLDRQPHAQRWFGPTGLDIGYGGGDTPTFQGFVGYDRDSPNYKEDGSLPFPDEKFDVVYSSNCLEHITMAISTIKEWFRCVRTGGFMVLLVPHKYLYEKKNRPPSNYNKEHCRFYTPADLLGEIEVALAPNSYRVRDLYDCDYGYDYSIPPEVHARGSYSIVCVIEKIQAPKWSIE